MNPGSADAGHGDPSRLMAFGSDRAASKRLPQLPSYAQPARPHGGFTTAMVVDRNWAFIGSMNLDPCSAQINSEMRAIIDSPCLAETLARLIERDMTPENRWHVQLSPQGGLHWVSGDQVLSTQPARSVWQRIEDLLFVLFPRDLY